MNSSAKAVRKTLVGDFLKSAREEAGLTQAALAKELCYTSAQFISNWERGVAMPPMHVLPDLATLLHIAPRTMLNVLHQYQEAFLSLEKEKLVDLFRSSFRSLERA